MSGFGNFIKKIEGKVDVDIIRETERTGLRLGELDEVVAATAARYRESRMGNLGTFSEYDGPTQRRDAVGEYDIYAREFQQIYDALLEQRRVDTSSE